MNKYFYKIKDKQKAIQKLTRILGTPTIKRKLSIYSYNSIDQEIQVNFVDRDCYVSFNVKPGEKSEKNILIKNNNIKYFLKSIYKLGFENANISEIIQLEYSYENDKFNLSLDTYIGDVITVKTEYIEKYENLLNYNFLPRNKLEDEISESYFKELKNRRPIFNESGILDKEIMSFANNNGIDIRSTDSSIEARINSFSNDYSIYEEMYKFITGKEMLSVESHSNSNLASPLSIIIPCFNVKETINLVLKSIEVQDLPKEIIKEIEVILVDDCSSQPVSDFINEREYSFKLNIVKLNKNVGISTARNIGYSIAIHEQLLFMDGDIILPKNYIQEVSTRLKAINSGVFVTFKENIDIKDISLIKITKGLNPPKNPDDLRLFKLQNPDSKSIKKISKSIQTEILADSNYFKELGFGRRIGAYDLPMMLIGHNFALNKKLIKDSSFFPKDFKGWGLEDTYFGAKVIANGNFIIPILSTGVFHIKHDPRSGSEEKKQLELDRNLKLYEQKIKEEIKNE